MQKYWLGFDLGGTKMLAEVFDERWEVVGAKKRKTLASEGQESGLERLVQTARDALDAAKISEKDLGGIGIGCPGPLDLETGRVRHFPNLGWTNVPLKDLLEATLGAKTVVSNDVDAGTYGEAVQGAGKGARSVLGVFPGTGIGGGFVYDNRIISGARHSALEIGHVTVQPGGARCGCGRRGCLETVASRLAIAAAAATAVVRGQAPWLKENAGSDLAEIRSKHLAAAVKNGDQIIEEILVDASTHLGVAIGNAINMLAPETVIIGGGLVEKIPDLMLAAIRKAAAENVMESFRDTYSICEASLGDHATSLGAAAWARTELETMA